MVLSQLADFPVARARDGICRVPRDVMGVRVGRDGKADLRPTTPYLLAAIADGGLLVDVLAASRTTTMQRTLLLNASYEPLTVIDWQRAVILVYLGKSDVLEEYNHTVRSARHAMRVPAVLRLRERVAPPTPWLRFSRTNVYARDGQRCQYCGARLARSQMTFDHVVPRSRGGTTEWTNIVSCCATCNRRKGDRLVQETNMQLLRPPRRPRWHPAFAETKQQPPPDAWLFYLRPWAVK